MARLPTPGSDSGKWGDILNDYLTQSHDETGKIKPGAVAKADIGLGNVDNTADAAKPVSTAQQTALNAKLNLTDLDAQVGAKITETGTATQTALKSSFAKPRRPRLAMVGDSIVALYGDTSGGGIRTSGRSAVAWANALLDNRFEVVTTIASAGSTWGFSGYRTDQIRDAGGYTSAAASDADVIFEEGGTNDIAAGYTADQIVAIRTAAWDTLRASGKIVVAATVPPRVSSTSENDTTCREVNRLLKQAAVGRDGVIIFDWYTSMIVPSTGQGETGLSIDGIHPNTAGGNWTGTRLAAILGALFPPSTLPDCLPVDDFSSKVALTNGFQAGTTGTFGGSNAANGSGTLPTGWICYPGSAGTVVTSKVARTDGIPGEWTQLVYASSAGGSIAATALISGGRISVGDTCYGVMEVETDAGSGWNAAAIFTEFTCTGSTGPFIARSLHAASDDRGTITKSLVRPNRLVLVTPHFVVPSGTTSVEARLRFYGVTATIRLGRANIVKVS